MFIPGVKPLLARIFVVVLFLSFAIFFPTSELSAAPNTELNFQGRILSDTGSLVADGDYHVEFNLYNVDTGGTTLWTETYTGLNRLRVANGYVTANLGSITAFPGTIDWSEELWLTINIGGNGLIAIWDGEMTPRMKVTAVPLAFRANELQGSAGSYTADDLVQIAPASPQSISDVLDVIRINQTGTGGLVQLQGDGSDVFTIDKTGLTTVAGAVDIDGASVDIGSATQSGALIFNDGSGNTLTLQPGTQAGDLTFTLPTADGASGHCLTTNGSGVLSFAACAGGGGGDILDGGNTNGASITIGTNDTFDFNFETDGNTRINIQADGDIDLGSNTLFVDDINNAVNVAGASTLEALNVNGGINLGNSANTNAGTIRWSGTDFEGYDGTEWKSLTFSNTPIAGQFYSSSTGDFNLPAYTAVPFDNEDFKDTGITHDNVLLNTRITLDDPGRYFISYSVSFDTTANARRTLECAIRLNGTTIVNGSNGYDYTRNNVDDNGTVNGSVAVTTAAANEYYEIVCRQAGTAGTTALLANQSLTYVTTNHNGIISSGGGAGDIIDGGNSTGSDVSIGTNDAFGLNLETNGITRFIIASSGAVTATSDISIEGGVVSVGTTTQAGSIELSDGSSNTLTLNTGSLSSDLSFTLPTSDGSNGDCLKTNGSGTLSFSGCAGGGSGDILDGGNTTGSTVVLGTNDANNLQFETNNVVRATIDTNGDLSVAGTNSNVDSRLYIEDVVTTGSGFVGTVYGPYTFDADNDADESAWTFVSDNGGNGLNPANTARAWSHDTNDTTSADVGPSSGQGGNPDGYIYTEASAPAAFNDTFHITHNTILDASTTDWIVEFYWNQRGDQNLATVAVQTNENSAGWVTRGTYGTGGPDVPTGGVSTWNFESLDLTGVISDASTEVRFLVTFPAAGTSWNNDFGLDTITIRDASAGFVYGDNLIEAYNANNTSDVDLLALRSDVGSTGNVVFRVDSDGDVYSDGTNNISGGADIAEQYKNNDGAEPGDVVYFVDNRTVAKTSTEHHRALAGVVSSDAAIILDASVEGIPVGLKGRLPTKVSVANGPIEKGDYLTSGPDGRAVKAVQSGSVIGVAMEPATEDGLIDVFVGLSYYTAPLTINLDGVVDPLTNEVVLEFEGDDEEPNQSLIVEDTEIDANITEAVNDSLPQSAAEVIISGFESLQQQTNTLKDDVSALRVRFEDQAVLDLNLFAEQWGNGELEKALVFSGEVSFLNDVTFEARVTFNADTAGNITVEAGDTTAEFEFENEYLLVPYVQLTPNDFVEGQWRVLEVTETGFVIELSEDQAEDITFNWQAIAALEVEEEQTETPSEEEVATTE